MAVYTTIDDSEAYFQVKLYTGNNTAIGSGGLANTFDGDTDMSPNLVWIKARADTESHKLYDSVRGVTKDLESALNTLENTNTEGLTAFGSDGFTIGNYSSINASTQTYVAWCWKESATAGFDIVAYTGTGAMSLTAGEFYTPAVSGNGVTNWEMNFGNPPYANSSDAADGNGYGAFEYAPPSGYLSLCSKNLGSDGG